jgi:subtilase family serine protease
MLNHTIILIIKKMYHVVRNKKSSKKCPSNFTFTSVKILILNLLLYYIIEVEHLKIITKIYYGATELYYEVKNIWQGFVLIV